MSNTVAKQFVGAIMVAGTILAMVPGEALAQRRYGNAPSRSRPVHVAQGIPAVDLPPPQAESQPFPLADEVIPPSLDDASPAPGDTYRQDFAPAPQGGPESGTLDGAYMDASDFGFIDEYECDTLQAADAATPIFSTGTWYHQGRWYTQMDFVMLTRTDAREPIQATLDRGTLVTVPLAAIITDATTNEFYKVKDLVSQKFKPGTRLSLGRFLGRDASGRDHSTEFTFLGFFEWDNARQLNSRSQGSLDTILTREVRNFGGLSNPDDTTDGVYPFFRADAQRFEWNTDFNAFEWNYRIGTRPGRDQMAMQPNGQWVRHGQGSQMRAAFAGMNVTSFNELVNYTSQRGQLVGPTGIVFPAADGQYLVRTNNDMVGVQLGADLQERYDDWSWGFRGKTGMLMNLISRRSLLLSLSDDFVPVEEAQKLDDEHVVFMVQAGLNGQYQLRPNLHLRAAYDFMLMSGLALATENLGLANGFPAINTSGTVILHGASVGFETTW